MANNWYFSIDDRYSGQALGIDKEDNWYILLFKTEDGLNEFLDMYKDKLMDDDNIIEVKQLIVYADNKLVWEENEDEIISLLNEDNDDKE